MENTEKLSFEEILKNTVKQNLSIIAAPYSRATTIKEVFDKDRFCQGAAIKVVHHTGTQFNAIISDSDYDYIQCYKVGIDLQPRLVEIHLEEYISGTWGITRL